MNEEICKVLEEMLQRIQKHDDYYDSTNQELNTAAYWLYQAAIEGLGQAVSNFSKEVMEKTNEQS